MSVASGEVRRFQGIARLQGKIGLCRRVGDKGAGPRTGSKSQGSPNRALEPRSLSGQLSFTPLQRQASPIRLHKSAYGENRKGWRQNTIESGTEF